MLTVKEFSKLFKVSPETVRKWCREGKLRGVEREGPGKPWRISEYASPPPPKSRYNEHMIR